MLIANPIYDVVFKRLMENDQVAKFFLATLLGQEVVAVAVKPQEYTYQGEFEANDPQQYAIIEERIKQRYSIWVYRLDFIATIKTADGTYKKVLIEIQKAKNEVDVMRFRNYLAEQYKKKDKQADDSLVLPITTIYILGFKLPDIESPCIQVARTYIDLIHNTPLPHKSPFIEQLTHDCFVVQVARITHRYQTRLDKLLSVFEQRYFTDDKEITKDYTHQPDVAELKLMTDILHYVGTNPQERKHIEVEQEAHRTIESMFANYRKELEQKSKALNEKDKALNEKDKELDEKDKELNEKDKELNEKDKELNEKDKELNEKDKLIQELLNKLNKQ
jgi:hypothetical protein